MNNFPEIKTVNIVPSWLQILPMIMDLHTQFHKKVWSKKHSQTDADNYDNIRSEFKKMAIAADNWNAHCKAINQERKS